MAEEGQEKQYKPSPKKLEDLKKKGTFLRSKELTGGVVVAFAVLFFLLITDKLISLMTHNFNEIFNAISQYPRHPEILSSLYERLAWANFLILIPVFLTIIVLVFGVTFLFGGLTYSFGLLKFKVERINPLKNLKRIFSMNNAVELLKASLKFSLLVSILLYFIYAHQHELLGMLGAHDDNNLNEAFLLLRHYILLLLCGVAVIVAIDMLYSHHSYHKKTMMTFQEVKDENKEMEGSPEVKRKIRQAQFAMSQNRMRQEVPLATVVITNPTHYAIALRYTDGVDKAPKVVAKGKDMQALEIRKLAKAHFVPIYEAPPLARAIYYTSKEGDAIHPELYMAVAIVLSYLYQLKHYQMGQGPMPEKAADLKIPEGFDFSNRK